MIRILICVVAITFVFVSLLLTKPVSDGGRLTRKLCIANAAGWLFISTLSSTGHPPPMLMAGILFLLINLVLLPAAAVALRAGHKERVEGFPFIAVASTYVGLNLLILFVVPVVWVIWNATR